MKPKVVKVNEDGSLDVERADGTIRKGVRPPTAKDGEKSAKPSAKPEGPPAEVKFFDYDLEKGVVTVNEYRAAKGLPSDPRFGTMTWPEYVAKNVGTFATKAAAITGDLAPDPGGEGEAEEAGDEAP